MLNPLSVKCFTQKTGKPLSFSPSWNPIHFVVKVQSVTLGFCFPVFDCNGRLLTRSTQLYPETLNIARFGGIEQSHWTPSYPPRRQPLVWRESPGGLDGFH